MSSSAEMQASDVCFDETLLELRSQDGWQHSNGAWWLEAKALDPRAMTSFMLAHEARLVTVASMEREAGETRLDYHWDLKGVVLTFSTITRAGSFPSIADLCPGADWIEREVHEYFAVEFTGRDNTKPLMLRSGLLPGLNRKQGAKL
jgi:Ni,Fe-hydrogenase III component G